MNDIEALLANGAETEVGEQELPTLAPNNQANSSPPRTSHPSELAGSNDGADDTGDIPGAA